LARRIVLSVLLLLGAAACATAKPAAAPARAPVEATLPTPDALPDDAAREALAAARAHEVKGDAAGGAHDAARAEWAAAAAGYADLAARPDLAAGRVAFRQRAADLWLRAQSWDKAAEAAGAVANDAAAADPSRAVAARLAATAWLGAANAAVKAGQLGQLDLSAASKEPRPVPAPWKRVVEATDAYLARASADPEAARRAAGERRPSGAELALVAAEVQLSHGEVEDARKRLEAVVDRSLADPDVLEQAVPVYLSTYAAKGDRAGQAAAAERLRQRLDAEIAKAPPEKKPSYARVQEALGRARAGARFAQGEELLKKGQAADAAKAFEGAAAEPGTPDRAGALHNAAVAWDQAGDASKAAAAREKLLKDFPEAQVTGEDALRLAAFRARQGDHLGAARLYEDFLQRWPASPSRCVALRNVATEFDRAGRGAEAGARYLAFGKDEACARSDPNIAARALVRAGRLFETQARTAFAGAAAVAGVDDPEVKTQVREAAKAVKETDRDPTERRRTRRKK
jgi:hypothetical protein